MDIDHLIRLATGERNDPAYVCRLPDPLPRVIGASARSIMISPDTIRKQLIRHRDFEFGHFEHVPWIIEHGRPLYDANRTNVLHLVADCQDFLGHFVKATVKATLRGHEIWLTSVHRLRLRDYRALERKARRSKR